MVSLGFCFLNILQILVLIQFLNFQGIVHYLVVDFLILAPLLNSEYGSIDFAYFLSSIVGCLLILIFLKKLLFLYIS